MQKKESRLFYIDVVRGLAIFIMLLANAAPYLLEEPYPFWFRLMSSLAAPVFVSLTGFMLGKRSDSLTFRKTLLRGLLILTTAVAIDILIWDTLPFATFDVLYVIGFSVLISPLFPRLGRWSLVVLAALFFVIAFALQFAMDYTARELTYPFSWSALPVILKSSRALFLDGWFPLFPWMGIFLAGLYTGKFGFLVKSLTKKWVFAAAIVVFALGSYVLYLQDRPLREGYGELFYPADVFFCTTALAFLTLFVIAAVKIRGKVFNPLAWLGRSSLFFYVLHLVVIAFFIEKVLVLFQGKFIAVYCIFVLLMGFVGWLMHRFKKTRLWQKLPYVLRFWLGS